mgnify:CR=1 FL=1
MEVGLKTLEESYAELGLDFEEQAEVRAQNARMLIDLAAKYQVPLEFLYKPSGGLEETRFCEETPNPSPHSGNNQLR